METLSSEEDLRNEGEIDVSKINKKYKYGVTINVDEISEAVVYAWIEACSGHESDQGIATKGTTLTGATILTEDVVNIDGLPIFKDHPDVFFRLFSTDKNVHDCLSKSFAAKDKKYDDNIMVTGDKLSLIAHISSNHHNKKVAQGKIILLLNLFLDFIYGSQNFVDQELLEELNEYNDSQLSTIKSFPISALYKFKSVHGTSILK